MRANLAGDMYDEPRLRKTSAAKFVSLEHLSRFVLNLLGARLEIGGK